MNELLVEFINTLKDLAPDVWLVLVKQVRIEVLGYFVWFIGIAGLFYVFNYVVSKKVNDEILEILQFLVNPMLVIILLTLFTSGIMRLLNPEFYAIQYILNTLR